MNMKFLIVNTDYSEFLRWLYGQRPGLEREPVEEQMRARVESLFGVADFYSRNLGRLGCEAGEIHANNEFMQRMWAQEHGIQIEERGAGFGWWGEIWRQARRVGGRTQLRYLEPLVRPVLRRVQGQRSWFYDILAAQIKHYKPDIVLNQAMDGIDSRFLREMEPYVRLLVGQIASPLPPGQDFSCYDLVISSLPNFVEHFRRAGLSSELNRFAFEPCILPRLDDQREKVSVSFVGSLSRHHEGRVRLLEHLCEQLDVQVWGQGIDSLPNSSPIRQHYKGIAWGVEMYQNLRNSKITLNHHISVAGPYANNMRLFEATGVGALLITDWKENLREMFEPGEEVIAYRTPEECVELIQYYSEHDEDREAIARAGQEKTLREHVYTLRMQELVDIIRKHL